MAGADRIDTPRGSIIKTGKTSCKLVWNSDFGQKRTEHFSRKQKIVDSEVLRYCSPLVPKITGMLEKSGILGTVIGSGEVKYITPYARFQYYQTAQSRFYDSHRGAKWFERMKAAHKEDIKRAAEKG
jgi:hypothetical protein